MGLHPENQANGRWRRSARASFRLSVLTLSLVSGFAVSQDFELCDLSRSNDVTLRKDCRCAWHAAPNACCGPGSVGWPPQNVLPSERETY